MFTKIFKKLVFTLLVCGVLSPAVSAQENSPFVVYDDELKNGWVNWSWGKISMSHPAGSAKPIKVEGEPWSALALHHEPFSIEGFSKLTFFINGGLEGGQTLAIKLIVDGKPLDSNYLIQPKMKSWAVAEVLLSDLGANGSQIDGIWFQTQAEKSAPYYVTRIQFE
ncbi:hypothetical protein [Paraglaciecola hydrolytica]|uniref:Carbohydrate binding module xylan-binding domain-containing protein n=1 Tax=Paraglaciecola hydrolytica TaxID=1799789 RepID=A0A148KLX3_9ALTE|nr:hypothetical protein [Paraglaciecola hydrolytica]KXI27248.1 hypothetical protein AX660_21180 [Paraglaciecola hydrolytica]